MNYQNILKPSTYSFAALLLTSTLFGNALAAQGDIGPVYVEHVSVVALAAGGHSAGNLEVKIKGGFAVPSGVSCDGTFITTLKSVDADKRLFALLLMAQTTKQPVNLRITDDPAYTAIGGRCSLIWVTLAQ